uniref:DUF4220 domain-containing protein n=2 Tax=Oryza brachyantha TaxID=4533 RepID=J3MI90_ORYBR
MLLWMAYLLADSTALFTLGHLSISSKVEGHQLVAFWAPLLLVHLGGQDTITAYSFEDNRLWLRHLQTLVVQVMGTVYVLYKYIPGSQRMVMVAAGLIFLVGILKYGERIWALRCATGDSIWSALEKSVSASSDRPDDERDGLLLKLLKRRSSLDAEDVLMAAHGLLDVCKGLFIGLRCGRRENVRQVLRSFELCGHLDKLMEMELSLMYDIMYTKAVVIHTWYGCCIRVVAPAAMVAAASLFELTAKDRYSRHDVVITYVLLLGGLVLELASLVRAAGSTWARAMLHDSGDKRCRRWLHDELLHLRQLFRAARHRRWSGYVGQYNLVSACCACRGLELQRGHRPGPLLLEWWHQWRNSRSACVADPVKEMVLRELLVLRRVQQQQADEMLIGSLPGLLTLRRRHLHGRLGWSVQDISFEGSIIAWHIASDICLFKDEYPRRRVGDEANLREAIRLLSDYMMFLLVARPYMLPGPVRRSRYLQVRGDLLRLLVVTRGRASGGAAQEDSPAEWALRTGLRAVLTSSDRPASYDTGVILADMLCHQPNQLEVIFGVWVEMLSYVADHCSKESHARQLSGGGELVTIVWLMARHANLSYVSSSSSSSRVESS